VGDSLHDAKLARQCQVPFVARAGTFSAADFATENNVTVADFFELEKMICGGTI
jgi:hypothetical protein